MTLHLEGRLLQSAMGGPAAFSACCESAVPVHRCPRSGSLSLLVNMTCVKVAGRGPRSWGLCSPHHSSSFHPPCPCSRGGVLLHGMGEKKKSEEDLNKQLQQTPGRPPPHPALMARREPWKNSKSDSVFAPEKCRKVTTTPHHYQTLLLIISVPPPKLI